MPETTTNEKDTDLHEYDLIKGSEEEGARCRLKLNRRKCELITTRQQANLRCKDNTRVPKVRLATCLGCNLGMKPHSREELSEKNANTVITMKE